MGKNSANSHRRKDLRTVSAKIKESDHRKSEKRNRAGAGRHPARLTTVKRGNATKREMCRMKDGEVTVGATEILKIITASPWPGRLGGLSVRVQALANNGIVGVPSWDPVAGRLGGKIHGVSLVPETLSRGHRQCQVAAVRLGRASQSLRREDEAQSPPSGRPQRNRPLGLQPGKLPPTRKSFSPSLWSPPSGG